MTWDGNLKIDLEPMPEPEPAIVAVVVEDLQRGINDLTDEELERALLRGAEAKIRKEHPGATILRIGEPTYTDDGREMTLNFKVIDPSFDKMTLTIGPFKDKDNA